MQIAIRMDDITPDMDWERFLAVKDLLDEFHIKPLLGIVPDNQDPGLRADTEALAENSDSAISGEEASHPEFWSYMKELQKQGWVLAMHGYRHIYTTKRGGLFPLNNFSEFAGLPYEEQKAMLADGKRLLQDRGIETDLFMAPAHSYDGNTLKALKECGFNALTDGFGKAPYSWKQLNFYPISFQLRSSLKKKKGATTMVLHAATMTDADRARVRGYLSAKDHTRWINFEDYLKLSPSGRTWIGMLAELIMAKTKHILVRLK